MSLLHVASAHVIGRPQSAPPIERVGSHASNSSLIISSSWDTLLSLSPTDAAMAAFQALSLSPTPALWHSRFPSSSLPTNISAPCATVDRKLPSLRLSNRDLHVFRTSAKDATHPTPHNLRNSAAAPDSPVSPQIAAEDELQFALELDIVPPQTPPSRVAAIPIPNKLPPCSLPAPESVNVIKSVIADDLATTVPPLAHRSVSFPTHLGKVRFFRSNERPSDIGSNRWISIDEPALPHFNYELITPNWAPFVPGLRPTFHGHTQPSCCTTSLNERWESATPDTSSRSNVPSFTFYPTTTRTARSPCPWDTVVAESVNLAVGVCPGHTNSRFPGTKGFDRVRISGTVLVANMSYTKRVTMRATMDFWHSWTDVICTYVRPSESPGFEQWGYELELTELVESSSATVYLCFHYEYSVSHLILTDSSTDPSSQSWRSVWDNNGGANYEVVIKKSNLS